MRVSANDYQLQPYCYFLALTQWVIWVAQKKGRPLPGSPDFWVGKEA